MPAVDSFMHLHFERIGGNPQADSILARGMKPGAQLLLSNDPQHKRYRGMLNSVFTSVRVNKWAPAIERITDELISIHHDDVLELLIGLLPLNKFQTFVAAKYPFILNF